LPRFQESESRAAEGTRLAALRDVLGMSQRELADEFQVTSGAIAQWETGQRTIPGPVLQLIALYERDLEVATPTHGKGWLESTSNLGVLSGTVMAQAVFASAPPSSIRARLRDRMFEKYVGMASRTRGLTMKWAQLVWGLDPILNPKQREALRRFDSLGPIMSAATAVRIFSEEFGVTPREAFAAWTPTPFASASLGQVHRATLRSGEEVAVKIQHPDALTRLSADLEQLRVLERIAMVFMRNQTPGALYEDASARYTEECDYRIEAAHQKWMRNAVRGDDRVRVPPVFDQWTSQRVLTTGFDNGTTVEAFARRASQAERDRAGEVIWRFYFRTIVESGVFNTDPNPGNFLFGPSSVTFLDFGRVKRVSPEFHEYWKRLVRGVLERNEEDLRRAFVDIGYVKDPSKFDFRHALAVCWTWCAPLLVERFAFTPAFLRHAWAVYAGDTTRSSVDMHPDMTFTPQLMFGLFGLLATLRARSRCRASVLPLLYPDPKDAPAAYTNAELRRFGVLFEDDAS
jgi:predicted unusual protein kinase regulating ubiquinone biosynthesis (AarF/ABC1/UbiB family)